MLYVFFGVRFGFRHALGTTVPLGLFISFLLAVKNEVVQPRFKLGGK